MSKSKATRTPGSQSPTVRETRRTQYEQRRLARERAEQQRQRKQRLTRLAWIAGGGLAAALLVFTFIQPLVGGSTSRARTIDGLTCAAEMASAVHFHVAFQMYANGKRVDIPANTGIIADGASSCMYPLHVHETPANIIHAESATKQDFTLGQVFDIWGQPLSQQQVLTYQADASHPITYEVFDANGRLSQITGDPRALQLADHQTVVILYNSPDAKPAPNTNWQGV